jgi:hypothetical protein
MKLGSINGPEFGRIAAALPSCCCSQALLLRTCLYNDNQTYHGIMRSILLDIHSVSFLLVPFSYSNGYGRGRERASSDAVEE